MECSEEEGVTMADSVETLGVDLRTKIKRLGAKEKARRKKCKPRFLLIKRNKAFQKNYMKIGVRKLLWSPRERGERGERKPWVLRPQKDGSSSK